MFSQSCWLKCNGDVEVYQVIEPVCSVMIDRYLIVHVLFIMKSVVLWREKYMLTLSKLAGGNTVTNVELMCRQLLVHGHRAYNVHVWTLVVISSA